MLTALSFSTALCFLRLEIFTACSKSNCPFLDINFCVTARTSDCARCCFCCLGCVTNTYTQITHKHTSYTHTHIHTQRNPWRKVKVRRPSDPEIGQLGIFRIWRTTWLGKKVSGKPSAAKVSIKFYPLARPSLLLSLIYAWHIQHFRIPFLHFLAHIIHSTIFWYPKAPRPSSL